MKTTQDKTPSNALDRVFKRRVAYVFSTGALLLLAFLLVWFAGHILLLMFAGVLIAVMLHGAGAWTSKQLSLRYELALGLVLLSSILVLGLAGWAIAPQVAEQVDQLLATLPASIQRLRTYLGNYAWSQTLLENLPSTDEFMSNFGAMFAGVKGLFSGVFGTIVNLVIALFVALYLAIRPKIYINGLIALLPPAKRQRGRQVIKELGHTLEAWLLGKFFSMIVVGIVTALGLALLDVPLALTLGVVAGLFDFIPYLGPILAGLPAVLIAFTESPMLALYVGLFFMAVQLAEGYLLVPLVERRTVYLPPALTIVMQVLLGIAFGLAGVALATPLTAVIISADRDALHRECARRAPENAGT